jgi:hypothetical protein
VIHRWKGIFKTYLTVYEKPPKFQNESRKTKKTNPRSFSDCRSRWSKEPQWENDYGSFLPCFLLVRGPALINHIVCATADSSPHDTISVLATLLEVISCPSYADFF